MQDLLIRAGCFVAIIILGIVLRRIGFFKENAFEVLSKVVIKITLPAAIVKSFSGTAFDSSMLVLIALGFGGGHGNHLLVLGAVHADDALCFHSAYIGGDVDIQGAGFVGG